MSKIVNFDKLYLEIEESVRELEAGEKTLNESLKIYEETTEKINKAKEALMKMEGKVVNLVKD